MKNQLIFALLLLSVFTISCEKLSHETCGVADPLENLPWLKDRIENDEMGMTVTEYQWNDSTFILVDCCKDDIADEMQTLYNCEGKVRCNIGGIAGFQCGDFNEKARKIKVLYK